MKKLLLILFFILASFHTPFAQVGIGTTTPKTSSILDLTSATKGFLTPRMTALERGAIVNPDTGLMVYQTDAPAGFYYYNGGAWVASNTFTGLAANTSLTGDGTTGAPLGINLGNSNIWTTNQTFAGTFLITANSRIALTNSDNVALKDKH